MGAPSQRGSDAHCRHACRAPRRAALTRAFSFSASVFTLNYENIPWLVETLADQRKPWPFGKVVSDEATKLKSFRLR